jgi:hypothetical protein
MIVLAIDRPGVSERVIIREWEGSDGMLANK